MENEKFVAVAEVETEDVATTTGVEELATELALMEEEIGRDDSTEGEEPFGEEEPVDYVLLTDLILSEISQALQAGDGVAAVVLNPEYVDGFRAELFSRPEEQVPLEFKKVLPIKADASVPSAFVLRHSDITLQFLESHFGPVERGGNGLLPKLKTYIIQNGIPVKITHEWLQSRYLDQLADRLSTNIILPGHAAPPGTIPRVR